MDRALPDDGTVVIVGASLAGLRCAEALRAEGFSGRILLVGEEEHLPYDRPPLSKQLLTGAWEADRVSLWKPERHDELAIELELGRRAVTLDLATREVELDDGRRLSGDAVVIATGASLRRLPGTEGRPHLHGLRTLDDALALRDDLGSLEPGSSVVLIGAGFIGQEVASAAAASGQRVTILEGLELPLSPIVGDEVARLLLPLHEASGAELRCGVRVIGIGPATEDARAGVVELEGGEAVPADLIVVGIGVDPATGWLEGSGLELSNGVVADEHLEAAPGIFAIGDVVRFPWKGSGGDELVRIEHWQMAADQAIHAARSMLAGPDAVAFDVVPYFWSDQWGRKLQVLGHPSATDDVDLLMEPDDEHRFLAAYSRAGRLTGVLAVSRPRQLMAFRQLLADGAGIADARGVEL